jgi:hypothetical protein
VTLAEDRKRDWAEERQRPVVAAYEDDLYSWALEQAELLRNGRLDTLDLTNLADEITDVAHWLSSRMHSDLSRILQHLLKWDYQPDRRSRSWAESIWEHRKRAARHLKRGPGLKSVITEIITDAYVDGRDYASRDTRLPESAFPDVCPYGWDEIMARPVEWPQATSEHR